MSNDTKRNSRGQYAKPASAKKLVAIWSASIASLGLLYASGGAVMSTFGSFRSCDVNNTGLYIRSCGKQSLSVGDVIIIAVFVAAAALSVSLFTAAWRLTTRKVV